MFWAWAGPAPQALTFIDRALGRPGLPSPLFYRQGLSQPGHQSLTSIRQTPRSYQPGLAA